MTPVTLRIGLSFATVVLLSMSFASAGEDQGGQVIVTRPGVVFHLAGAHDFHGRAVAKSSEAALAVGYTPCPVCFSKTVSNGASVARPGAAATAAVGTGTVLAPVFGPTVEAKGPTGTRGHSGVGAAGCLSHDAECPYGLPFRTIPGL